MKHLFFLLSLLSFITKDGFSQIEYPLIEPPVYETAYPVAPEVDPYTIRHIAVRSINHQSLDDSLVIHYRYRSDGKLASIKYSEDELDWSWNYTYTSGSKPSRTTVYQNEEKFHSVVFAYKDDYFVQERRFGGELESKTYYYYDDQGRVMEQKSFFLDADFGLQPTQRIVYTYNDRDSLQGEMHYSYSFSADQQKVVLEDQQRVVHEYDQNSGRKSRIVYYTPKRYASDWASFASTQKPMEEIRFFYDYQGRLLRKEHRVSQGNVLKKSWDFHYNQYGMMTRLVRNTYHSFLHPDYPELREVLLYSLQGLLVNHSQAFTDGRKYTYYYDFQP